MIVAFGQRKQCKAIPFNEVYYFCKESLSTHSRELQE